MNRRFVAAFAAVCIVAALGSAAFIAYRVLAENAAGRIAAKADFEGLRSVLAYVKSSSDLADPGLRARLASRYEASPKLLLVDIYERGEGDRWRIPAESPYLPPQQRNGALPEPIYPPSSTILLSTPLKGDNSGLLAVDALYTSLTQQSVFEAFRDALIGLASFLALAALVLAVVSGTEEATTMVGRAKGLEDSDGAASADIATSAAAAAEYQYETLVSDIADKKRPLSKGISIKAPVSPVEDAFDIPIMGKEGDFAEAVPDLAEASPLARGTEDEPSGLYSPASGLGWESYLNDRLDAELSRSASFEQDLSLLVICYDGLSTHDAQYGTIGDLIKKFFSFRDLAFERGDDGFSVILPNIDSSHAIRMAEEFYKKLVFLAEGDFAELELLPLFVGISSRSGRLVDAVRMVEEAGAALEKAHYEKDSRIVAFRPDPDKYRLFLSSKGA